MISKQMKRDINKYKYIYNFEQKKILITNSKNSKKFHDIQKQNSYLPTVPVHFVSTIDSTLQSKKPLRQSKWKEQRNEEY